MTIPWNLTLGVAPVSSSRIIEDEKLVDYVEDWSKVRSPARARRRLKRGFKQNIAIHAIPQKTVYSLDNGRTLVMHPETARALERQLAAQMDRSKP